MKTRSIFLLLFLVILLPEVTNGQIGVLRRAINRQLDQKIDSAIDKSAQDSRDKKLKEEAEKNPSDSTSIRANRNNGKDRGLFGGKIDINYNDKYDFTGRIYSQVETYDKKDVVKSEFYTYFNSSALNVGIEVRLVDVKEGDKAFPTVFLFDNANRCLMMLIDNDEAKTGIISTMPSDSAIAAQPKTQKAVISEQPIITKTGKSRTIAGYLCDEYKVIEKDKEGYSNIWMTKDVKLKVDKKYWTKAGLPSSYNFPEFEEGMMLAMEEFDKKDTLVMKMETKEITEKFNHSISTVGFVFMKMNFGQIGK